MDYHDLHKDNLKKFAEVDPPLSEILFILRYSVDSLVASRSLSPVERDGLLSLSSDLSDQIEGLGGFSTEGHKGP